MKIMVIDDVGMNILALKQAARTMAKVEGFQDAEAGLTALRNAYRCGSQYDLLFLDILMPGRSGLEVLKDVQEIGRQHATGPRTKVIMLTSLSEPASVREAIRLGAAGYVLKPIQPERIQDELRRIAESRGVAELERQAGEGGPTGEDGQEGQAAA
jgi:CheY-like chemotaxis protein